MGLWVVWGPCFAEWISTLFLHRKEKTSSDAARNHLSEGLDGENATGVRTGHSHGASDPVVLGAEPEWSPSYPKLTKEVLVSSFIAEETERLSDLPEVTQLRPGVSQLTFPTMYDAEGSFPNTTVTEHPSPAGWREAMPMAWPCWLLTGHPNGTPF